MKNGKNNTLLNLFFILLTLLVACRHQTKEETQKTRENKPPGSFTDTITIDFPAAVFYSPDSIQAEKIKTITDPEIYNSQVHEYQYQFKNSIKTIKNNFPDIQIVQISQFRFIRFIFYSGQIELVDLNSYNNFSGLFLFDQKKKPGYADMTNIDTELNFYFNR